MMRIYLQTIEVRLLGVVKLALIFIVASKCQQSFAQIFLGIGMRIVQLEGRFKVHNCFGKRSAVCIERTSSDETFDIPGVNGQSLVQALECFGVSALLEVLNSFGDRPIRESRLLKDS